MASGGTSISGQSVSDISTDIPGLIERRWNPVIHLKDSKSHNKNEIYLARARQMLDDSIVDDWYTCGKWDTMASGERGKYTSLKRIYSRFFNDLILSQ